jgi:hypothetical protein
MRGDSESRSRYLSLALTSRKAINSLRAVVAGNPVDQELGRSLQDFLAGVEGETNAIDHLQASKAWTHFEELSTVDELKNETGAHDLGNVVSAVLRGVSDEVRRQNARRLIGFLTAVEGRALQHYTESLDAHFA